MTSEKLLVCLKFNLTNGNKLPVWRKNFGRGALWTRPLLCPTTVANVASLFASSLVPNASRGHFLPSCLGRRSRRRHCRRCARHYGRPNRNKITDTKNDCLLEAISCSLSGVERRMSIAAALTGEKDRHTWPGPLSVVAATFGPIALCAQIEFKN